MRGCFFAFSTVVLVWIVSVSPSSASFPAQASDLHIQMLTGCCCSVTQLCLTLCDPINCSRPAFPVLHHLLEFAQTHVHWVSVAIQSSHPLFPLLLLPSILPSIKVFSNDLALRIRWPNHGNFSFSINHLSNFLQTHGYLFYTLVYNPVLLHFLD